MYWNGCGWDVPLSSKIINANSTAVISTAPPRIRQRCRRSHWLALERPNFTVDIILYFLLVEELWMKSEGSSFLTTASATMAWPFAFG